VDPVRAEQALRLALKSAKGDRFQILSLIVRHLLSLEIWRRTSLL